MKTNFLSICTNSDFWQMITRTHYTQMHAHILMQISFMDEYEGLSEDEALLTSTRRIVNLWCLVFVISYVTRM